MSRDGVSWIDKGVESDSIAHKQHSNVRLTTPIRDIAVHDGHLYLAMSDGNIQVRKRETGKLVRCIKFKTRIVASPKRVFCNTIVAHNGLIFGGYSDGFVRGWQANGQLKYERGGHRTAVKQLIVSGDKMYSVDDCCKLLERDPNGNVLREFDLNNKWVRGIVSVSHSQQLWIVHHDGVYVWQNDTLIEILHGHEAPVLSISQPWNDQIWTGDKNGVICLWDMNTFALLRRVKYGSLPVVSFTHISNDYMLALNDSNIESALIAALNKQGNLIKFLFPLPDTDTIKYRVYSSPQNMKSRTSNAFTLYSASSISALEAKKVQSDSNDKFVLSQMIMDHECGRLWIGFKSPMCLQSYNLHSGSTDRNTLPQQQEKQNIASQANYIPASEASMKKLKYLRSKSFDHHTFTDQTTTSKLDKINESRNQTKSAKHEEKQTFSSNLRVDTDVISSAKSMVLSPGSMSIQKGRLMEFAQILNTESQKLQTEKQSLVQQKTEIEEQKAMLQQELKDIKQRTETFECMINAEKQKLVEKKEQDVRISKIQENLINARTEVTKYRETCNNQMKKIKALQHSKSMIEYQLKQTLQQLQEIKQAKVKRAKNMEQVNQLMSTNHAKELEYVAEIEEKTTKLTMTEEMYNNVKLENDKLKQTNSDLVKQVDELLNIANERKEQLDSLQNDIRQSQEHEQQCQEFMLSLFDHCYRSNDNVKPPPFTELRCFAQKTSAVLSWFERHENKVSEKMLLHNETHTEWQNRCNKLEKECEDLRTLSNSQKEHITKLEHDLILLSTNEDEMRKTMIESQTESKELRSFKKEYEKMLMNHHEMLADNKEMATELRSLRSKYKQVTEELEQKSLTLEKLLNRFKVLQIQNDDMSSNGKQKEIKLKQMSMELSEKTEECEATHLNYIRMKMEHSQLKSEYDKLKADYLITKTELGQSKRNYSDLERKTNDMKENMSDLKQKANVNESAINEMNACNQQTLDELQKRIQGLQNENSILVQLHQAKEQ